MPANRPTPWLLCYDIANPRRLQRVHRAACRHATPLQYSVFHTITTRREILAMIHDIEEYIDPGQDDVRAYQLLTTARPVLVGRGRLPSGIMLCYSKDSAPTVPPSHVRGQRAHVCQIGSTHPGRRCFNEKNTDEAFKPQT